ncbi:hypothetical protein H1R20_g2729, partial [Candolleomyces eurysporus]
MPPELQWYFERAVAKYRCPQDEECLPQLDTPICIPVAAVTPTAAESEPDSLGFVKVKASAPIPSSVQHNKCFVLMKKLVGRTGGPAQTYLATHSTEIHKQHEFGNYLVLRAYSKKDESSLTTFRRELAVFTRLSVSAKEDCSARDCIVGLDAAFVNAAKQSWYFAMPLLRCNLAHVLTRERADVTDTVRHELSKSWITQLATGLDHLHNRGIIHSNLKPSNILLDWDGCVKISDFSCVYIHPADEPLKGHPVQYADKFCGSLPYMAPEQRGVLGLPSVRGSDEQGKGSKSMLMKKGFGKEVDVWALGCVAAELCRDDHYKLVFESDADFEKFTKSSENDRREYLHQYAIPTHFQVEFILQLLEPNVSKRLKISDFKNTQYYKMNKNLTFSDYGKKKLRVEDIPDFILEFDLSKESISKSSDVLVNVNLEDKHNDNLLGGEEVFPWIPPESRWFI